MKHKHHIIPKHAGGSNDPSNLVELTIEEHAEAHRKLYEQYGRPQDRRAWMGLAKLMTSEEIVSEILHSPKSDAMKAKLSNARKGKSNPWAIGNKNAAVLKGKTYEEILGEDKAKELKATRSKAFKTIDQSYKIGNTWASAPNGRPKTKEHQYAITAALNTKESKEKAKATRAKRPIVACPHCGVQGKEGHNMKRFHFNNCKDKKWAA